MYVHPVIERSELVTMDTLFRVITGNVVWRNQCAEYISLPLISIRIKSGVCDPQQKKFVNHSIYNPLQKVDWLFH